MARSLLVAFLVLSLIGCASTTTTTTSPAAGPGALPLWAGLTPGPYPVGFLSSTLPYAPHPLQVSVWYPSGTDGAPMTNRSYLLLNLTENGESPTKEDAAKSLADAEAFLTKNGISTASAEALFHAPVYARANAHVAAGKFPLVFVVQGNEQSASGQAVLSEFLASHGYVVATIPSITRMTGVMKAETDIVPKAEAEMADIDRAISSLKQWPDIDETIPVTLVAHSFGARSALLYAMHHPPVNAIVSLEGGIGMSVGQKQMVDSKSLDLTARMPPVLHFYELNDDSAVPDFRLLRSLRSPDLQLVRMDSMHHVHFSSDGFAAVMLPDMAKATKAGPHLKREVDSVAKQTLAYIDKWVAKRRKP